MASIVDADNDFTIRRVPDKYVDADGIPLPDQYVVQIMGQGPSIKIAELSEDSEYSDITDEVAVEKDKLGYTNLNLHRRIENPAHDPVDADNILNQEIAPRNYRVGIMNVNSYRTITKTVHDENSVESEIP